MELSKTAIESLENYRKEFMEMLDTISREEYIDMVSHIAVYEALYRMIHNNTIGYLYMSEFVENYKGSIVSYLTLEFFKLEKRMFVEDFLKMKLEEFHKS